MTGLVIFIHAIVCLMLVVIILMQSGRGGGLTEGFAAAESVFGAKTNDLLIKGTTVFATLFLVTCLSLAFLSSSKDKSLMAEKNLATPGTGAEDVTKTLDDILDNAERLDLSLPSADEAPVE
ncbi:preprotein translocase subunit SecG [Candidatus Omnitrophota bacterium]